MCVFKRQEVTEYGFGGKASVRYRYSPIDIYKLSEPLEEGETLELPEIYIGNTTKNKFVTRLIVTKLSEENKRIRQKNIKKKLEKVTKMKVKETTYGQLLMYITHSGCCESQI